MLKFGYSTIAWWTILTFVFLVTQSSSALAFDEEELAERYNNLLLIDWSWKVDCSNSRGRFARQACSFYAYPIFTRYVKDSETYAPSVIDEVFKENFDKIVSVYSRLKSDTKTFPEPPHFILELNSSGGNIATALAIGRKIRDLHGDVRVNEKAVCISACVIILMAGEDRWMNGEIGIHRPFIPRPDGDISQAAIKKSIDQISSTLVAFAIEMNVSPKIIDDMFLIPSERVRRLTEKELTDYGLVRTDPVVAETRRLEEAKAWGLSSIEYMVRKEKVRVLCNWFENQLCYRDVMSGRR